jgi:hypothetical protein
MKRDGSSEIARAGEISLFGRAVSEVEISYKEVPYPLPPS